ncbi:MAG TPA: multidrug effflux MFS transporter [Alphaproteobacteria bacterium]|jgi:DHA1 family bicyclomycin/chloramphenicol resistance-like MFS transporter
MSRTPNAAFAVVLAAIALASPLAIHLFLPVIPWLKADFGLSDALAQLAFSISLFTMAFTTLVYGALSDRFGRRPVLLSGLALFLVGSAASAFAETAPLLIGGRVVQAMGAGAGVALSRVIARDAYGPEALVKAIAYLTMAYTLGPFIAPPVAGLLVDSFGWRSVFWFALGAGGLIAAGAYFILYETHTAAMRGTALSALDMLRGYGRLFANPRFDAFVLQTSFSSGTFFTLAGASSTMMQVYLGRPATEFGLFFAFCPAGYFAGNLIASRMSGRVRLETMVLAGSALLLASVIAQAAFVLSDIVTPLVIFVPAFAIAVAQGLALSNAQAGAIRTIPALAGTASGIGVFLQLLGGAVFSQLYGLFADGTPLPMIAVMAVAGSLTFACGLCAFLLRSRPAAPEPAS